MLRTATLSFFLPLLLGVTLLAAGCDVFDSSDNRVVDEIDDIPTSVYNGVSIELDQTRVAKDEPLGARVVNNSAQTVYVVASSPCNLPLLERQQGEGLWSRLTLSFVCPAVIVNEPIRPGEAYPITLPLDNHEPKGMDDPVYIQPGTHRLVVQIAPEADADESALLASHTFTITEG